MKAPTLETPRNSEVAVQLPVTRSEAAEASSAHARINIPLNLANWKEIPQEHVEELMWFHQYALDEHLSYEKLEGFLGYDKSTIFRVLKGTYEGSWKNIIEAIRKWRKEVKSLQDLAERRSGLQSIQFVENSFTKRLNWILTRTLDYSRQSLILGDGGMGKTAGLKHWGKENNHGRSVIVEAMPVGGAKGLLRQIAEKVSVNKNQGLNSMLEAVIRAFDHNRILIIDEIQHHAPAPGSKSKPIAIDLMRRIADISGCGLALIGTNQTANNLKANPDFYEQVIRRCGKPYYLPDTFVEADVLPIVSQFLKRPSKDFMEVMVSWANDREVGRLNYIVDMITFAAQIAHDTKKTLTEDMILAGHQLRENRSKRN